MRSPAFLLMLPLMEQPTRTGPNSVAAMMPPTAANPRIVGKMPRRENDPLSHWLRWSEVEPSSENVKQLNLCFVAFYEMHPVPKD
jgi:hypothetical protein